MALDSRPRPVRRHARRRVHLFTTLTLLVMAAGLWFAGSTAGPAREPVPAPRLQVAEARVAAAEHAIENPIADEPAPDEPADTETLTVVSPAGAGPVVAVPVTVTPAAAPVATGPRAPPRG